MIATAFGRCACRRTFQRVASCLPGTATETLALSYLENDALDTLAHGNGLVTDFAYYPKGPIESITVGSAPLHRLAYAIDVAGNVDTIQGDDRSNGQDLRLRL